MTAPLEIGDIDLAAPLCEHCAKPEWRHVTDRRYCYSITTAFDWPEFDSRLRFRAAALP